MIWSKILGNLLAPKKIPLEKTRIRIPLEKTRIRVTLRAEARPGEGPVQHRWIRATFTVADFLEAIETGKAAWGRGERADVEAMILFEDPLRR